MKKQIIQVDFNPWHFICNMQCQYCIKHYAYKVEDNKIYIKDKNNEYQFFANVKHLFIRSYRTLKRLSEKYEVGILTFSGTEAFLFEEIFNLLDQIKELFPRIQIITNGLNLSEAYIKKLKEVNTLNNISISLSLDGYDQESNYSRTGKSKERLEIILNTLKLLAEQHMMFDIYTVVNKHNIKRLFEFYNYLAQIKPNCGIQIWPVFGIESMRINQEDIVYLEQLLQSYDQFKLRLQPKRYYEYLIEYLKTQKRNIPCYLPYCSFYLRDNGEMKACLCNGIVDIGNVFDETITMIEEIHFYKSIVSVETQCMPCSNCFINWDLLNLYFLGQLTVEEVRQVPLLDNDGLMEIVGSYKHKIEKMRKEKIGEDLS